MIEVAGPIIGGLLQSFQSIHALTGDDARRLMPEPPQLDAWYPLAQFQSILQAVADKHQDIKGLVFRAGIEFIQSWHKYGPGKELIFSSFDFLHFQTNSQGYHSVVRAATPEENGFVQLDRLDKESGEAEASFVVPFPAAFSHGVFVGGMSIFDDLDFLDIQFEEEDCNIPGLNAHKLHIRFREKADLPQGWSDQILLSPNESQTQAKETLYWKYRGLQQKIAYERIYRDQLNDILIQTAEDLQTRNEELSQTRDQMIEQEKLASLGQLTAGVAHEINNPINFVINNSVVLDMDFQDLEPLFEELTKRQPNSSQIADLVQKIDLPGLRAEMNKLIGSIKSGAERVANIVSSLRYLSYSDHEARSLTDMRKPIEATLTILESRFKTGVTVHKDLSDCPPIIINAPQINQVLINLLTNAIQAMNGKGDIWLRTQCDKGSLTLEVEDNGPGIDPAIRERIFEPFFTTRAIGEGTGLGLAITQGIVQGHGGHIEVLSDLGKGTTFRIQLPCEQVEFNASAF